MSYTCFAISEESENSVLYLEVKLNDTTNPISQPFMINSYYDLIPIIERYW